MDNNETKIFNDIFDCLGKNILGRSMHIVRKFVDEHPYMMYDEGLDNIERDYKLMQDYFRQGFNDPKREAVYENLVCRLYTFASNLLLSYKIKNHSFYSEASRKSINQSFSNERIKTTLENFVTDMAMLSLEPKNVRDKKSKELYSNHNEFIQALFCHIVVSRQWTEADAHFFENILLSPTIDTTDAQVIISALTLAVMNIMDANKLVTLINIYLKSDYEHVRQRALIGWVFALSSDMKINTAIKKKIKDALNRPDIANELHDLQKQIIFCMNAEKDNDKIQKDIIPELIKNNNLNITRFGITEKEEDPMMDVFDPEASDRAMEKMESSFRKMTDMQKAGSDIYFGGFSQMKKFSFFYNIANWFYPFYLEHPEISSITEKLKDTPLLTAILNNGPFCDSDKYSFTLAISTVISRLPENMREIFNSPDALGQVVNDEDKKKPAYIRRMILQDMYRFFRLFPQHSQLANPFDENHFVFITNSVFHNTGIQQNLSELCYFMLKHKSRKALGKLLKEYKNDNDPKSLLLHGIYALDFLKDPLSACGYFKALIELEPENKRALSLLSRSFFEIEDYDNAAEYYGRLYHTDTENKTSTLNYCIALSKAQKYDKAINMLYKLSLDYPESKSVIRVLAWTLMGLDRLDQAEKEYNRLLTNGDMETGDWLNGGYCQWFKGNTDKAIMMFNKFLSLNNTGISLYDIEKEFIKDYEFLKAHNIKDIDIRLMTDIVNNMDRE